MNSTEQQEHNRSAPVEESGTVGVAGTSESLTAQEPPDLVSDEPWPVYKIALMIGIAVGVLSLISVMIACKPDLSACK